MSGLAERLRRACEGWSCALNISGVTVHDALAAAQVLERMTAALAEIREEFTEAEINEKVTPQEARAIELARRMYQIAVDALEPPA